MQKPLLKLLFISLVLIFIEFTFAQSDEPCSALSLSLNSSCTFSNYTNVTATASPGVPAPGCANYSGGDVWFSVTVPSSGSVNFDANTGVITDGGMAVYSGTCSSLSLVECDDDDSGNGLMPYIALTGRTPGETLWIRFWEYGNNNNGSFQFCAYDPLYVAPVSPCTSPSMCLSPIPDDCNTVCSLGALSTPTSCPTSSPVTDVFCLSNIGASAENPYNYIVDCQGVPGNDMPAPSSDVWYSFTATSSTVTLTVDGLNSPSIALYQGTNCSDIIGLECENGSSGTVSITNNAITVGQNYLVRISGADSSDVGNFNLIIQSSFDCDACLIISSLSTNPTPTNNTYQPGDVVEFCFTVSEWTSTSVNWFHGVEFDFSSGWDLSTLTPTSTPATCDASGGTWGYYTSVTSTNTGNTFGNGFYFDADNDGNPGNNFGDNCDTFNWKFCVSIEVIDTAGVQNGDLLSLNIETYGDSESGSWSSMACEDDPVTNFVASISACINPTLAIHDSIICNDTCNGSIIATGNGTSPYNFEWRDTSNTIIRTQNNILLTDTANSLCAGTYYIQVTDNNSCVSIDSITLVNPPVLTGTHTVSACNMYTWSNGTTYTSSTTSPLDTLSSSDGCDSITPFNITILSPVTAFDTVYTCFENEVGTDTTYSTMDNACDSTNITTYILHDVSFTITPNMVSSNAGDIVPFYIDNDNGNIQFNWTASDGLNCPNCLTYEVSPTEHVTYYYFTLTDTTTNCIVSDTLRVDLIYNSYLNVPNIFTPNGDGQNDIYRCYGEDIVEYQLEIFDRWGGRMFITNTLTEGWDGVFNNLNVESGIYMAVITAADADGQRY